MKFADLPSSQQFRQSRSARNRSRAAPTEKSRFSNLPIVHTNGDFQDISAYRVADIHGCRRILQLPGVARILEVIEERLGEHEQIMAAGGVRRKVLTEDRTTAIARVAEVE